MSQIDRQIRSLCTPAQVYFFISMKNAFGFFISMKNDLISLLLALYFPWAPALIGILSSFLNRSIEDMYCEFRMSLFASCRHCWQIVVGSIST